MNDDLETVWGRCASEGDVDKLLGEIPGSMKSVHTYIGELEILAATMKALIAAAEARRLGRVGDIKVTDIAFDGKVVSAFVTGTTGVYTTHITVLPARGHHCTCPDWVQNGKRVGPCKHVLALGTEFRDTRIVPALDRVALSLMNILEHSEV